MINARERSRVGDDRSARRRQPDVLVLICTRTTTGSRPILKRQHPSTGVLIVADRLEPALLLEAMRAGVTEVVAAPLVADIEAAINRLAVQRSVTPDSGMALAFVGARGVGTTTVAVNVAPRWRGSCRAARCWWTFVCTTRCRRVSVPNRGSPLSMRSRTRIASIEAFFRNLIVKTKAGGDLLSSSERVMTSPLDVRRIRTLLEMAERHYRYVVLDISRSDAVLDALEGVKQIVVVANQELATVRAPAGWPTLRQRHGERQADGGPEPAGPPRGDRSRTNAPLASR